MATTPEEHQWDVRDAEDGHLLQYVWGTLEHAAGYAERHFGDRPTIIVHGSYCHGCPDGFPAEPCCCESE